MNETVKGLSYLFMPIILLLFGFGIYQNIKIVTLNKKIDKTVEKFKEIKTTVIKYIIHEATRKRSGSGPVADYDEEYYQSFIEVQFDVNGKNQTYFGKIFQSFSIDDNLNHYESLPNRPPFYFQQKSTRDTHFRRELRAKLENYKSSTPVKKNQYKIGYNPDNPEINELTIGDKKDIASAYFFYGIGMVFLLVFLLFGRLGKLGNAIYTPLIFAGVCLLVYTIFLLVRVNIKGVTLKPVPLPEAAFEMKIGTE